ncbi:hypothetical protein ACFLXB_09480 [Chloroflexota bacterium]
MKTLSQIFSTDKQAKWRTQIQWSAVFLVSLASIVIISAFYVNISTKTSLAGRKIALTEGSIQYIKHEISDLEAKLASLQSVDVMETRARELGFIPAEPGDFLYVVVPGYSSNSEFTAAPISDQQLSPAILPEYTESLIDWVLSWGQR